MRNLPMTTINNVELLNDIVSHVTDDATKERLNRYNGKIIGRYQHYENNFTSLDNIRPLDASEWSEVKDDLVALYKNSTQFKKVRNELLSVPKCPFCTLSRPNTLDHYFDKSDYPEFSVFTPNLVPVVRNVMA